MPGTLRGPVLRTVRAPCAFSMAPPCSWYKLILQENQEGARDLVMDGVGGGPGMSPASRPASHSLLSCNPSKNKGRGGGSCAVQDVLGRAELPHRCAWEQGGWSQGLRRGSRAGMRCQSPERAGGGLRGGLCSLPAPGKAQPQRMCPMQCPILPPKALPSPALARGGSTGGAAPGFGNLIRAVPGAGAALGSPAGAGAAEPVRARLLHGSGQCRVPQRSPWCCGRSCLGVGCAGGRREAHADVGMARGESRRAAQLLLSLLPHGISMWQYPLLGCWTSRKSDLHEQDVWSYDLCPWKL